MDNLVEQVVKKKKNARYYLNIALIIIVAVMIPVTFIFLALFLKRAYFVYIAFFCSLFSVYGMWYFISSLNVEFEYACLGNIFRVDKIIAKRNRKNILKIDLKIVDDIFKYSDDEMSKRSFNKVFHVASQDYSNDNYVITYVSEAKGKCAVVFSPKEKTLNAFRPYLKREIVKELY
ncbi:MAG: hypothetical protein IKB73_05085 [Ruminococcus sp.]|nr:hypothetical protein [Ruminococcus sp.]